MSLHGFPSSIRVTPQTGPVDSQPVPETGIPHQEGLDQIRNQIEVMAPKRSREPSRHGHPGDGLQQIRGQKASSSHIHKKLGGKSKKIRERLTDTLNARLTGRLSGMTREEQKAVKALLHFSKSQGSGLPRNVRMDIRTILAGFLAHGMGLGEAGELREILVRLPATRLARIARNLVENEVSPVEVLSNCLLNQSKVGPAQFQQYRRLIQSFPPDPTRAGMTEYVDGDVTLVRDNEGRIDVGFASAAFVRIGPDNPYPRLSEHQRDQIREAFDIFCSPRYSRMGLALDIMGAFQAENDRRRNAQPPEDPIPLREFVRNWVVDGQRMIERYGKSNCMAAGQAMLEYLNGIGIRAYPGGVYNASLVQQRHADNHSPSDAIMKTMGITHIDVLIPYTTDSNEERVIVVIPGMGNHDLERYLRDLPIGDPGVGKRRVSVTIPLNLSEIQKNQLGHLTNLIANDRPWGEEGTVDLIVGIDLVEGTIGLNRAATARYREAHGGDLDPENEKLNFSYREAMAHPGDLVPIRVWDSDTNTYNDQQLTRFECLTLFLHTIKEQFHMPDEFVSNALALMSNEREYHSHVLWPSTRELNKMNS